MKGAKRYIKVILILFLKRLSFGGNCTIFGPKMTFTHNSGSALNDFFTMKWVHLTLFYYVYIIYRYIIIYIIYILLYIYNIYNNIPIYIIYIYIIYLYIYNIYIYSMVFTTEEFLEVAIESWPEWDLNHDH